MTPARWPRISNGTRKGIYIPEVTFFNGPEHIPDNLVQEFQDLFLARKPYSAGLEGISRLRANQKQSQLRATTFLNFGSYVNGVYVAPDKGAGIFGHCTHFLSGMSGIASQFWQRYEFTGDKEWLRGEAYPMIKGVAEFYANFPNLKKESDGKYHIYHVNRIESDWDSQDTSSELGAMRSIFPMAIRASQILGVDEDLRPKWQDIADNLALPAVDPGIAAILTRPRILYAQQVTLEAVAASGIPCAQNEASSTGNEAHPRRRQNPARQTVKPARTGGTAAIAAGAGANPGGAADGPERRHRGIFGNFVGEGDGAIEPLGSEPELKRRFLGFNMTGGFIDPSGDGGAQIFRNRLRLREGPGAIDAEHLGGLAFGIHQSLLTSTTDDTVTNSTIQVFPAGQKIGPSISNCWPAAGRSSRPRSRTANFGCQIGADDGRHHQFQKSVGPGAGQGIARQHHRNLSGET